MAKSNITAGLPSVNVGNREIPLLVAVRVPLTNLFLLALSSVWEKTDDDVNIKIVQSNAFDFTMTLVALKVIMLCCGNVPSP